MTDSIYKRKQKKFDGGFVMLYAILITVAVISIGLSLLSVLIEQVPISGLERESSLAFYSADIGLECALYWDNISSPGTFVSGPPWPVTCNNAAPLGPGVVKTTSLTPPPPPPDPGTTSGKKGRGRGKIGGSCKGRKSCPPPPPPGSVPLEDWNYAFQFALPQGGCADLHVIKTVDQTDPLNLVILYTSVESRGYNTTCPPAASTKPWRMERGLRVEY